MSDLVMSDLAVGHRAPGIGDHPAKEGSRTTVGTAKGQRRITIDPLGLSWLVRSVAACGFLEAVVAE